MDLKGISNMMRFMKLLNKFGRIAISTIVISFFAFLGLISLLSDLTTNNFSLQTLVRVFFCIFLPIALFHIASLSQSIDSKNKKISRINERYPRLSVAGIMLIKREEESFKSIKYIMSALVIYLLWASLLEYLMDHPITHLFSQTTNNTVLMILSLGVLLIIIKDKVISYRLRNGLFGKNESEAREIIHFILENRNDIDFTDGGNSKRIIDESDIKNIINGCSHQPVGV